MAECLASIKQRQPLCCSYRSSQCTYSIHSLYIALNLFILLKTMRMEGSCLIDKTERLRKVDFEAGPAVRSKIGKYTIENTVFSQKWAISFWDEAQWLRTEGHLSRAAYAIRVRSASTVLCSATPLHNGERVRMHTRSYVEDM